jgi:hypothetical protein
MRRLVALLVVLHAGAARADGAFKIVYGPVKTKVSAELADGIRRSGGMETLAASLTSTIKLPRDLPVVFTDCGVVNAFYAPEKHAIVVCYELMEHFTELFSHQTVIPIASTSDLGKLVGEATVFAFFHELGHALIGELAIPATGREEDAVDEFATLLLSFVGDLGDQSAVAGAFWFMLEAEHRGEKQPVFWDEHSFDLQRLGTIVCILYGHNPDKFASLMTRLQIPEARQKRCITEFPKKKASWSTLLKPYIKSQKAEGWQ